ncbi:MAG: hypothetical protein RIF34_10655 [Candidatus Kapaibacterium sp.]
MSDHISETLNRLKGYASRIDELGDFCEGSMLYYRKTKDGKYIVVNHFNRKMRLDLQGFDSWICDYAETDEPGIGSPIKITEIRLGLRLPRDRELIDLF